MGQVVPFIARVHESGDWTAAERARLEALADRLAQAGVNVEVVFGATDEGDPWCVVTDENGDVLIHVARIDGVFVVHSSADDSLSEGDDLHAALRDRLAATEDAINPPTAKILPFSLSARQGQTLLALVVATAFFYETSGLADPAEAAEPQPAPVGGDEPAAPPPAEHDDIAQERHLATQRAAQDEAEQSAPAAQAAPPAEDPHPLAAAAAPVETLPAPAAPNAPAAAPAVIAAAPAEAPPPAAAPVVIQGTAGDDVLIGTAADEVILGGGGNDTIQGGGGYDLLDGGDGDDRIALAPTAIAIGGRGADTFVVQAPEHPGGPNTLLGVVFDFSGADGDRIVTATGHAVPAPPGPPPGEGGVAGGGVAPTTLLTVLGTGRGPGGGPPPDSDLPTTGPTVLGNYETGARVDVDLDNDGVADGYILILYRTAPGAEPTAGSGATVSILGSDPDDTRRVLIDITGDGVADGAIPAMHTYESTLMMVGKSLLSHHDPFA